MATTTETEASRTNTNNINNISTPLSAHHVRRPDGSWQRSMSEADTPTQTNITPTTANDQTVGGNSTNRNVEQTPARGLPTPPNTQPRVVADNGQPFNTPQVPELPNPCTLANELQQANNNQLPEFSGPINSWTDSIRRDAGRPNRSASWTNTPSNRGRLHRQNNV